jgi:dTDP-4-amino-4,6-dideoxygalactose transaminase
MTLDVDDVEIARHWLKNHERWGLQEVISEYEAEFARWNGSAHAFSFMGGRVALSAIIHALGLRPGDEVILPAYTCVVVPNAFQFAGIKMAYSDIELDTYGLDASQIENRITSKTRAILLHHLYGLVCRDYEAILELARKYDLRVIEDCAHSTGAEYRGKKVGNYGDAAFYSSEKSKVFNTIQGGIAVTNSEQIARGMQEFYERAVFPDEDFIDKLLYNIIHNYYRYKHPRRWLIGDIAAMRYDDKILVSTSEEEIQGIRPFYYGCRMPTPVAAIGLNQLAKTDRHSEKRRQTAKMWDHWCDEHGYKRPMVIAGSTPVYLRYPVMVEPEKKKDTSWAVRELNVSPGVWFISHIHPADRRLEGYPNADKAINQCINLPTLW